MVALALCYHNDNAVSLDEISESLIQQKKVYIRISQ